MAAIPLFTRIKQMNAASIICTSCGVERPLKSPDSLNRFIYAVLIGKCEARCKSCSMIGRKFPGRKNPGNDGAAISARMKGNSFAKGMDNSEHIAELAKINKGNRYRQGYVNEKVANWKGEDVGYSALHSWLRRHLGKPDTCQSCSASGLKGKQIHWANKSGNYLRDFSDWLRLCAKCHKAYDMKLTFDRMRG